MNSYPFISVLDVFDISSSEVNNVRQMQKNIVQYKLDDPEY